ncbi:MAG: hypothetical protein JNM89_06175 [Hyphomicrobiaceae bacterium]|nr:hypothetical protein [Hyphomicrobiaceae bacterium]
MATKAIPNLYLKWRVLRELVGVNRSDAVISENFFGPGEGPIKFSKLLKGDYGCATDIADYITGVINDAVLAARKRNGLSGPAPVTLKSADLWAPLYEFTRKLQQGVERVDEGALDRAHAALLQEMSMPAGRLDHDSRLLVRQFAKGRMFDDSFQPSGGGGPVVFEPEKHLGQLSVEGIGIQPEAAYAFITRDTAPLGKRLWEMQWGETVMWLPSPFKPKMAGQSVLLMDEPKPVSKLAGSYTAVAALILDRSLVGQLDPRGADSPAKALDEVDTARFLTNLRRLTDTRQKSKRNRASIVVVSEKYIVAENV